MFAGRAALAWHGHLSPGRRGGGAEQGGIVPMYAVVIRNYLPPREAGARIGLVLTSTIVGMAFGGYLFARHLRCVRLITGSLS